MFEFELKETNEIEQPSRLISTLPSNSLNNLETLEFTNNPSNTNMPDVSLESISSVIAPPNQIISSRPTTNNQQTSTTTHNTTSATDLLFRQIAHQPGSSFSSGGLSQPGTTSASRVHDHYTRLWLDQHTQQELQRRHMAMRRYTYKTQTLFNFNLKLFHFFQTPSEYSSSV